MILSRRACCLTVNSLSKFKSNGMSLQRFPFENRFSDAEKQKILGALNFSNAEELLRFKVPQTKLKTLINWKDKNGSFNTVSDLLEVNGVGINFVETLCESILSNDKSAVSSPQIKKNIRHIITPALNTERLGNLTSAVGLHVESTGVSWAKLETSHNELTDWNYCDFSTLPLKVTPTDTFNLAVKIMEVIPAADIYIFESKQAGNKGSKTVVPFNLHMELTSMLLALINTQRTQYTRKYPDYCINKVYFLKSRLPARLFGVLVGSERVSTEAITLEIINPTDSSTSLPCSKVSLNPNLTDEYCKCSNGYKDLLDRALLLVITFMDLCVYSNADSWKALGKIKS